MVVSAKLHSFCSDLFPLNKFEVCGYSSQVEPLPEVKDNYCTHKGDPQIVVWVNKSSIHSCHYPKAIIDGVHYAVGF